MAASFEAFWNCPQDSGLSSYYRFANLFAIEGPMTEGGRKNPGLTWRSMLALLFSLALVEPMMIYSYLVTGVTLPIQIGWWPWIVILVWSEI